MTNSILSLMVSGTLQDLVIINWGLFSDGALFRKSKFRFFLDAQQFIDRRFHAKFGQTLEYPSKFEVTYSTSYVRMFHSNVTTFFLLFRSLDLTNNQLQCEGAKILARHVITFQKCRIQKIILALNKIGDEGCQALCQVKISITVVSASFPLHFYFVTSNERPM